MKKIISFVLCLVVALSVFAFPSSADNEPSYDVNEVYNTMITGFDEYMVDKEGDMYDDIRNILNMPYHAIIPYIDENELWNLSIVGSMYPELSYNSDRSILTGRDLFATHFIRYSNGKYGINYSPTSFETSTSSNFAERNMPLECFLKNSNFKLTYNGDEYSPFNANDPPDIFRYSIDKPDFTLKNDEDIKVHIEYTGEYLAWLQECRDHDLDFSGSYDFIIYVSSVKPTNTETLARSLQNVNYVRLNYGEYIYEGGVGYASLVPDTTSKPDEKPTSHSGKSPSTHAQGVNIVHHIDPVKNPSMDFQIKTENIWGFDTHTPIYVCVFASYAGNDIASPNMFNNTVLENSLTGYDSPNDTYSEFWTGQDISGGGSHYETGDNTGGGGANYGDDEDVEDSTDNRTPDYTMHSYFFPFDCVESCKGDGFGGNYTYKPQNINGKDYNSHGRVTDLTNKEIPPDLLHDVDMDPGEWVKPEDYSKWQYEHYNANKYDENYKFDAGTLKEIFGKEGDFFTFLKSAFSIFPAWVTTIIVSFICCLLAIALLKFIL